MTPEPTDRETVSAGPGAVNFDFDDCGSPSLVAVAGGYQTIADFPPAIVTGFLPTQSSARNGRSTYPTRTRSPVEWRCSTPAYPCSYAVALGGPAGWFRGPYAQQSDVDDFRRDHTGPRGEPSEGSM